MWFLACLEVDVCGDVGMTTIQMAIRDVSEFLPIGFMAMWRGIIGFSWLRKGIVG